MPEYRILPEFPLHRIGDDGSVWSLRRSNRNRLAAHYARLKGCCGSSTQGYVQFCILDANDRPRSVLGHVLVLRAFVGECPDGMEGCHGNGDRSDNRLDNLRWDTCKANQQDAVEHGTKPKGASHYNAKLTESDVRAIRAMHKARVPYKKIAEQFSVTLANIKTIISGRSWAWVKDQKEGEAHGPNCAQKF